MNRRFADWLLPALSLAVSSTQAAEPADHLFTGEHIITMTASDADPDRRPTAVAVRGDNIVWIGDAREAEPWTGPDTKRHELGGRALLPGFLDAHGHLTYLAATLDWANLASPPVGPVTDLPTLQSTLAAFIEEREIPAGAWVIGNGYDDSLLAERRHPERAELDAVSRSHPIVLIHVSGHLMAANSLALAQAGIDAETMDPPGGHIRRQAGSREPNGVLEETATYPLRAQISKPRGNPMDALASALSTYASYGITTVQDGAIAEPMISLLTSAADAHALTLDVVVYPVVSSPDTGAVADRSFGSYHNRLKFGGVKLLLDGSPQGKTAYLTRPYFVPPDGKPADYRGYPTYPDEKVNAMVNAYLDAGIPIIAHANGDAAADQLLAAVSAAEPGADHRTVMIHAQTVRDDQLDGMKALGVIPSFFSTHVFFWGDWHRDSVLGPERGARISPTRSATVRDIPFTIHNDAPVVPPDVIRLLWATTARTTRSGAVLGADQGLTVYEALTATTRNAARQYFEEDRKGTLAAGMQADLVILSEDPLSVPPEDLLRVQVSETWSRGRQVYAR
ncbi:MAG: amidohydrolase [Pseudomonadales bacterium]